MLRRFPCTHFLLETQFQDLAERLLSATLLSFNLDEFEGMKARWSAANPGLHSFLSKLTSSRYHSAPGQRQFTQELVPVQIEKIFGFTLYGLSII